MRERLKVLTVVGTRPEIIRLAPTIKRLDQFTDHVVVHTGQNYDYQLNEVFFEDLGLRKPDHFLHADVSSLGTALGSILIKIERVLQAEKPDAFVILGDTNSAISAIMAKRMKIPVYHLEAGNRSFDENVPEETNRRIVDHVADYNLVYSEHARRNLLAEGIHPSRILLMGSPMREVLEGNRHHIDASSILERLDLAPGEFFLASLHREENVDNPVRLRQALESLRAVAERYSMPVLVSTHPRTRNRLESQPDISTDGLVFHPPFGFNDYIKLQLKAKLVLSDSGTIAEESSILGFPAITLRDAIERPEAIDTGAIITASIEKRTVLDSIEFTLSASNRIAVPSEYQVENSSTRVANFIRSTVGTHRARSGLRVHPVEQPR